MMLAKRNDASFCMSASLVRAACAMGDAEATSMAYFFLKHAGGESVCHARRYDAARAVP